MFPRTHPEGVRLSRNINFSIISSLKPCISAAFFTVSHFRHNTNASTCIERSIKMPSKEKKLFTFDTGDFAASIIDMPISVQVEDTLFIQQVLVNQESRQFNVTN